MTDMAVAVSQAAARELMAAAGLPSKKIGWCTTDAGRCRAFEVGGEGGVRVGLMMILYTVCRRALSQ